MACAHTTTRTIRCNRTEGVLPLRITFGKESAERYEWCVDCGAVQVIQIEARGSVTMRESRWVLPRKEEG